MQLIIAAAALGAAAAVLRLMARSRFGREWRAFADDPAAAALFGVASRRLIAATFVLAGALAGLAGWVIAVYYGNVGFAMGTMLGLKALVAAVLGGIGSVAGAFLRGGPGALVGAGRVGPFVNRLPDARRYLPAVAGFLLGARRCFGG